MHGPEPTGPENLKILRITKFHPMKMAGKKGGKFIMVKVSLTRIE